MDQQQMKQAVADAALEHIRSKLDNDTVLGIGTGSTANLFIDNLASIKGHKRNRCQFGGLCRTFEKPRYSCLRPELGQPARWISISMGRTRAIAPATDHWGGGRADPGKIVTAVAEQFICIADESKLVHTWGNSPAGGSHPDGAQPCGPGLVKLGGDPVYREGVVTDNGNIIPMCTISRFRSRWRPRPD